MAVTTSQRLTRIVLRHSPKFFASTEESYIRRETGSPLGVIPVADGTISVTTKGLFRRLTWSLCACVRANATMSSVRGRGVVVAARLNGRPSSQSPFRCATRAHKRRRLGCGISVGREDPKLPRTCTVCRHSHREEIELALMASKPL